MCPYMCNYINTLHVSYYIHDYNTCIYGTSDGILWFLPPPIEMPTFCGGTKLLRNPLVHDLMEKSIGRLCRFKKSPSYIMKEMDAKNWHIICHPAIGNWWKGEVVLTSQQLLQTKRAGLCSASKLPAGFFSHLVPSQWFSMRHKNLCMPCA